MLDSTFISFKQFAKPQGAPEGTAQKALAGQPTPEDRLKYLEKFRFDARKSVPKPVPVISIGEHILATAGNIMTVVGPPKAGKSAFLSAIKVGLLAKPGDTPDLLGLAVKPNPEEKAVIHIDGEQSEYDYYRGLKLALRRASRCDEPGRCDGPEWFLSYNFREVDISQRIKDLELMCETFSKRHNGVAMIILDGGADFVLDVNDQRESNEVVKRFESLAMKHNCPVLIVLHFNHGTEKGRGHFGSQLERKSESVISVTKDKDSEVSTIAPKLLRNSGGFPPQQFKYDNVNAHHVGLGEKVIMKKSEAKEKAKGDDLYELAMNVCPDPTVVYVTAELCKVIAARTGQSDATIKNKIAEMTAKGILIKVSHGKYRRNDSYLDLP